MLSPCTSGLRAGRSERAEDTLTLFVFLAVLVRFLLTYLRFSQGPRSTPIKSTETERLSNSKALVALASRLLGSNLNAISWI